MKKIKLNILIISLFIIAITVVSCNDSTKKQTSVTSKDVIFPTGKEVTNGNFKGSAFLTMLMQSDTLYNTQIGNVTFEPGARTKWHYHKGGQILLVTKGRGYYQEKGKQKEIIQKGDVVKCPPNIIHWHGASSKDTLVHIAISPNTDKGSVVWLEHVSDAEYNQTQK